ncbi:MAG: transglutaminase domain-containing protein [Oscillospiraceae bacterium]|jgi:hypothetical protein|nr:transglutaminase domain-containing protein [Oscillospiraceae bacterium]
MPKEKKTRKNKTAYHSVYIAGARKETGDVFYGRIAVKTGLVCMSSVGLALTLAQIYKIPVPLSRVASVSFTASIIFNIIFVLLKKRAIIAGALLLLPFVHFDNLHRTVSTFFDYILYVLDSRLLSTARFAARSFSSLQHSRAYAERIEWTFLAICVVLCLIFTIGSRSRYIGVMLITSVFLLIPAFGAEIARYVPGIELLAAGMFGTYAMWAAHAGNVHKADNAGTKQEKKFGFVLKDILKPYPGKPPHFYKYGKNALAAACISLVASYFAAFAFTEAVRIDFSKIIEGLSRITIDVPQGVRSFFKHNFGVINDNGYFSGSISPSIDSGADVTRPPTGATPVVRVTLEDNTEKVYLKGDVFTDFLGDKWSTGQDSEEFYRLGELLKDFYPEAEYQVYRQKLMLLGYEPDNYIGLQRVKVDYLVGSSVVFLPTQPYELDYKRSDRFDWSRDTVLRPKNNSKIKNFECYSLYPKLSLPDDFGWTHNLIFRESRLNDEDVFGGAKWILPRGMDAGEYDGKIDEYYDLISRVYGRVPADEYDNIERLKDEIMSKIYAEIEMSDFWGFYYDDSHGVYVPMSRVGIAEYVSEYIRNAYYYSLDADNKSGDGTLLGNFLFETKSGHCALYASAMTLVMRHLGFPARYVTGFVVSGSGSETEDGYEYDLSESELHAWCEVYFRDLGWVPFDPTGGAGGTGGAETGETGATTREPASSEPPASTPPPVSSTPRMTAVNPASTTPPASGHGGVSAVKLPRIITIAAVALIPFVLAASVIIALRAVKKSETAKFARFKDNADNETAEEMYRFMFRLLKARGVTAKTGETPVGFASRVDSELNSEKLSLSGIMHIFEKLEFSNFELTREEYASLYEYVDALYGETVLEKKGLKRLFGRIKFGR